MARVFPSDVFIFLMFALLDQLLGFPDCWISLNRSLIFRLRSASSSHVLIEFLEEEL